MLRGNERRLQICHPTTGNGVAADGKRAVSWLRQFEEWNIVCTDLHPGRIPMIERSQRRSLNRKRLHLPPPSLRPSAKVIASRFFNWSTGSEFSTGQRPSLHFPNWKSNVSTSKRKAWPAFAAT